MGTSMIGKAFNVIKAVLKWVAALFLALLLFGVIYATARQPSLDRDWVTDQAILPTADIRGDMITVHNVRDFRYATSGKDFIPHYYDAEYDLKKLKGMYFVVEPFSPKIKAFAHTMFSFEFEDGKYVMVSVEIRKQKGDHYSPIYGFFNKYELMYVVGDEQDLLGSRATLPGVELYMYPVATTKEKAAQLFMVLMNKVNTLAQAPEFYNTISANCTTKLVDAVNVIADPKIKWSWRYVAPGFSDEYAYSLGLIDNSIPFDELRKAHYISDLAKKYQGDANFSEKIRENI